MGKMRMMSPRHGDLLVVWDPDDEASVEKARREFEMLTQGEVTPEWVEKYEQLKKGLEDAKESGEWEKVAIIADDIAFHEQDKPKKAAALNAFSIDRNPRRGTQLDEFDPEVGEIMFSPPMAGG